MKYKYESLSLMMIIINDIDIITIFVAFTGFASFAILFAFIFSWLFCIFSLVLCVATGYVNGRPASPLMRHSDQRLFVYKQELYLFQK